MKSVKVMILILVFAAFGSGAFAQDVWSSSVITPPGSFYTITANAELGFVKILANNIQIGQTGSMFNYVTQGGEEILFPFTRYSVDLALATRHHVIFLYQPLLLKTQTVVPTGQSLTIDGVTFGPSTPVDVTYSFPFWRVSYLYDFIDNRNWVFGAGVSVQLRNASIRFENVATQQLAVSQNLGIVPIIKLHARYQTDGGFFVQSTVDGFYASSALFNGASFSFEGSILDASLQTGLALTKGSEVFLGARFIGGTAKGNSQYAGQNWTDSKSTYTDNSLATLAITLGARIH
jgi:hypothetical protein